MTYLYMDRKTGRPVKKTHQTVVAARKYGRLNNLQLIKEVSA